MQSQSVSQTDANDWPEITGGAIVCGGGKSIEILILGIQRFTHRPADVSDGSLDFHVAIHFCKRLDDLIKTEWQIRAVHSGRRILLARNQYSLADLVSTKKMWDFILRLKWWNEQNQRGSKH